MDNNHNGSSTDALRAHLQTLAAMDEQVQEAKQALKEQVQEAASSTEWSKKAFIDWLTLHRKGDREGHERHSQTVWFFDDVFHGRSTGELGLKQKRETVIDGEATDITDVMPMPDESEKQPHLAPPPDALPAASSPEVNPSSSA